MVIVQPSGAVIREVIQYRLLGADDSCVFVPITILVVSSEFQGRDESIFSSSKDHVASCCHVRFQPGKRSFIEEETAGVGAMDGHIVIVSCRPLHLLIEWTKCVFESLEHRSRLARTTGDAFGLFDGSSRKIPTWWQAGLFLPATLLLGQFQEKHGVFESLSRGSCHITHEWFSRQECPVYASYYHT